MVAESRPFFGGALFQLDDYKSSHKEGLFHKTSQVVMKPDGKKIADDWFVMKAPLQHHKNGLIKASFFRPHLCCLSTFLLAVLRFMNFQT